MWIFTARFNRRKAAAAAVLLGILLTVLICAVSCVTGQKNAIPPIPRDTSTPEQRLQCLQSLGWQVEPDPVEILHLTIPLQPDARQRSYNQLQLRQGLDLTGYAGRQVCRYTYRVANYPGVPEGVQANLYVCDGTLIAGDIFCSGQGGFQRTLIYPASDTEKG